MTLHGRTRVVTRSLVDGFRLALALVAVAPVALLPGGARAAFRSEAGRAGPPATTTCSGLPPLTNSETTDHAFPGVRSIVVRGGTTDVHISPSSAATTNVHTTACWGVFSRPTLAARVQGGVLSLSTHCPSDPLSGLLNSACRLDISLAAPPDVALDVATSVGDVTADGMSGSTSLSSGVGNVSATSARSHDIHVATGVGNAIIDAATSPHEATATSGTGGIQVRVPAGAYAIDAATALGHVTIAGVQRGSASPNRILAHGKVGDVQVTSR